MCLGHENSSVHYNEILYLCSLGPGESESQQPERSESAT